MARQVEVAGRKASVKDVPKGLIEAISKYGPEIESALEGVRSAEVRGAIAGAVMTHLLGSQEGIGGAGPARQVPPSRPESKIRRGEPHTLSGTQARIMDLDEEDFFVTPRSLDEVLNDLRVRGHHHNRDDARMSLLRLVRKKMLRRIEVVDGKRKTFAYVRK